MTLDILNQIFRLNEELEEEDRNDFDVDTGENNDTDEDQYTEITDELIRSFQERLNDFELLVKQGADPAKLMQIQQELMHDMQKYSDVSFEDLIDCDEDDSCPWDFIDNPNSFHSFLDYYQVDCLQTILSNSLNVNGAQPDRYALYVNYNEILPPKEKGKKTSPNDSIPPAAGMTLGMFLVDTLFSTTIGTLTGEFLEYPIPFGSNSEFIISKSVKKEIQEQLWNVNLDNLKAVNKKPKQKYLIVFDPIDIMELMFRGIAENNYTGILRIDNSVSGEESKLPFVKNVKRYLETARESASKFSVLDFQKTPNNNEPDLFLINRANALTRPPLNLKIEYGPLPAFDDLLSDSPEALAEEPRNLNHISDLVVMKPQPKKKKKAANPKRLNLYYVHVEMSNLAETDAPPVDITLCVNRPILNEDQAMKIVHSGSFHWLNEEIQTALQESQKLPSRYALNLEGEAKLGFFYTSIPLVIQLQILALTHGTQKPADFDIGPTIVALDNVLMKQKKTYSLETHRDFYISLAKAGGFRENKPNSNPTWKEIWKGWGLMIKNVQIIIKSIKKDRQED